MKIYIFGPYELINKILNSDIKETPEQLFDKARALFKEQKTGDGYVYLQVAAIKGHSEAAFQMGSAISEHKTFGSMEDAVKYYTIASNNNHPQATTNLATCYQLGRGVDIDYIKAIALLNKAIKLGDKMAAFNLAQTYFFGVGVTKDEAKGWRMLSVLADKGIIQARQFMDNLLQNGYKEPIVYDDSQSQSQSINDKESCSQQYTKDHAPECILYDKKIIDLYDAVISGSNSAKNVLMDLAGNELNREAMNALRKLGLIAQRIDDDFKRGTIEYIAKAWKTYDVEPLYVASAWTYPGFVYREFRSGKIVFETTSEIEFVERLSNEMSNCIKNNIIPKYMLRRVNNDSCYCADVLIQDASLSSFFLDIKDGNYVGIYRVY